MATSLIYSDCACSINPINFGYPTIRSTTRTVISRCCMNVFPISATCCDVSMFWQFPDRCFRWYASIYSNSNTAAYCYGTDCRRCWKSLQCDYDRHRIVWCLMNHYDQTNNLYLRRHWHSHTLSVCGCAYQLCWM